MIWKFAGTVLLMLVMGTAFARPYQCDELEDAASNLESAAQDLLDCARKHDYSEDCSRLAREVRDAADTYESVVSDAENTFVGETVDTCPSPIRWYP